ncbi:MAG: response regulator [Candidatus Omnitrophica bacterium]|nr:response regulator [Candidatus Omnitrophota bacterium]MBU1996856.1 response regulator [Candidatus Omnitrophota bacterium]MBU4334473.1 response regulator [Candidatus Omnitrophota bacterium]
MGNIKILMADDEKDVLDIMARKVQEQGYDVVKACDGNDALEKIIREAPDIILLDINMPGRNGFEILKDVRENPTASKWQPVIIVSARNELDDLRKGYKLQADHYITKPCSIEEIIKAIKLMVNLIPQRKSREV